MNCIGSEGDGVDSNGTILISGGELYIAGSGNSTDAALDADGGILINGGYVFAAGSLGMVESPPPTPRSIAFRLRGIRVFPLELRSIFATAKATVSCISPRRETVNR